MLSASTNTLYPAFSKRQPDRTITSSSSGPVDRQLSRGQLNVWSYQEPPLTVGEYTLRTSQHLEVFDPNIKQTVTKELSSPDTQLRVSSPNFQLVDPHADIHSVYPASGHSDYAKTLAHVVFNRPTTPWEREITGGNGGRSSGGLANSRIPWLGVLSFTEDELALDESKCRTAGIEDPKSQPSSMGTISTTASHLETLTGVVSPLSGNAGLPINEKNYSATDRVNIVLITRTLFQELFTSYKESKQSPFVPDLGRFSHMSHVRQTHAGFMASTVNLMSNSGAGPNPQPEFSVVVSPRTGPPGEDKPRRVISHLISLEGVSRMTADLQPQAEFAGLVSLFSWDWMCVPESHIDFRNTMESLGKNVQPLRIEMPKEYKKELDLAQKEFDKMDEIEKPEDGKPEKKEVTVSQERKSHAKAERTKDPMATWIQQKLYAGYTLKPHTLPTGEITRSLMRGPFIPVSPARDMISCFSMTGEDLGLIDSETGIEDISYKMAWHLGRSLAMADRSFTAALLRFRGHVHAEAVQRVKARRAVTMKVNGTDTGDLTLAACFGSLHESVNQLQKAHDITNLTGGDSRWLRKREDRQSGVLARLAVSGAPLDLEEGTYIEELEAVVNAFFGFPPPHTEANPEIPPIPQRAIDSDAVLVRAWALDKFFLAGFPLHNLVPDPDMLPRESIRTFCIDPKWVDSVIDGGLSMANHFANGDDVIRRAIKSCLNRYMAEVRSDGPGMGTTVQMPKWGFLLRSIAVTAFPDLKVEAKFSEEVPEGIREVLYMQLLADDILLCLFDRKPGEDNFNKICISQPSHQQSFEAGESLTKSTLKGWFRPIPLVPLSSEVGEERKKLERMFAPAARSSSDTVYDWETRMIRPDTLFKRYVAAMAGPERDATKVWKWKGAEDDVSSAVLALQLNTPNLQLTLNLDKVGMVGGGGGEGRWTKPGAELDIGQRTKTATSGNIRKPASAMVERKPINRSKKIEVVEIAWVPLPTGISPSMMATSNYASSLMPPQHSLTAQGLEDQNSKIVFLPHAKYPEKATLCPWPSKAACFALFDPDSANETSQRWNEGGSTIHYLKTPMDLVFALKQSSNQSHLEKRYPELLEVRIPVKLSQGQSTNGGGINPLLIIPGTAAAPVLPKVEGLNGSALWSYNASLVVGSLFIAPKEENESPKLGDLLEAHPNKSLLLVITAQPRFGKDRMKDAFFDGSFILRQVRVVHPDDLSGYRSQFDISWEAQTAYPRQITVQPAVTLKMGEPTHLYLASRKHLYLHITVASSRLLGPDEEVICEAKLRSGSGNQFVSFSLAPHLLRESTSASELSNTNLHEFTPQSPENIRLYVKSKSTGRRVSPRSARVYFPEIPRPFYPIDVRFTLDYPGINIYWKQPPNVPKISGADNPYKVRVMLSPVCQPEAPYDSKSPVVNKAVDAQLEANMTRLERDVHIWHSDMEGDQTVRIVHQLMVESKRLVGLLEERADVFTLLLLDTFINPVTAAPLDLSNLPTVHSRSQFITYRATNELWFVEGNGTITCVHWRRANYNGTVLATVTPLKIYKQDLYAGSVGAFAISPVGKSLHKHQLAWVKRDGGIDAVERTQINFLEWPHHGWKQVDADERWASSPMPFKRIDIAHTYFGSICMFGTEPEMYMVWAGPRGEFFMSASTDGRFWGGDRSFLHRRLKPQIITKAGLIDCDGPIMPEGEIAVAVSKAICAAGRLGKRGRDFFWVRKGGGIRWMRFQTVPMPPFGEFMSSIHISGPLDLLSVDDEAHIADSGDADTSGCGPVALSTFFESRERLFIFWIDGTEGRVWGKTAILPEGDGQTFDKTEWSSKFCVTPNGADWPGPVAHPTASRLTYFIRNLDNNAICQGPNGPECNTGVESSSRGYAIYLLWFDPEGRLCSARTLDNESQRFTQWTRCMLTDNVAEQAQAATPGTAGPGRKMELLIVRSTDGSYSSCLNVHDLVWVGKDERFRGLGVEMGGRWNR